MNRLARFALAAAALSCAACALVQSPAERADEFARAAGFRPLAVPELPIQAYWRSAGVENSFPRRLTIYVEGDGAPWPASDRPPPDPTPAKPLSMRMAAADPSANVAYLGRPCQYVGAATLQDCDPALWTHGRFSEQALSMLNRAVDTLKAASGAREIALVGYSGGGTAAALLAMRRDDTACLVSIAAPLDTAAWTSAIEVSPLRTSLNPAEHADALKNLAQTHFTGGRDTLVPAATISAYIAQTSTAQLISRADFDHGCCWAQTWPELRQQSCLAGR